MHGFYVNPRRCARGQFDWTSAVNFAATGLFNNDSTKLLRVLDFDLQSTNAFATYVTKTRLTSKAQGTVVPVVTDEPTPPGLIDTQDIAAVPTVDYFPGLLVSVGFQGSAWMGHNYPFAVIKPGWTFVAISENSSGTPNVSFFWDWVWPDELENPLIGDPTIDRAQRP